MAAWGVEARVPFLDLEFLEVAMGMDPAAKMVGPDGLEKRVSDGDLRSAPFRFPHNPPKTKEGYLYRAIFEEHFPLPSAVECVPGGGLGGVQHAGGAGVGRGVRRQARPLGACGAGGAPGGVRVGGGKRVSCETCLPAWAGGCLYAGLHPQRVNG